MSSYRSLCFALNLDPVVFKVPLTNFGAVFKVWRLQLYGILEIIQPQYSQLWCFAKLENSILGSISSLTDRIYNKMEGGFLQSHQTASSFGLYFRPSGHYWTCVQFGNASVFLNKLEHLKCLQMSHLINPRVKIETNLLH